MSKNFDIIASTTFGMEYVVKKEAQKLGFSNIEVSNGQVRFEGEFKDIAKANIYLRSAERVYLLVGEFDATDFDMLYEKTKELNWSDLMPKNAEFPVSGNSVKSELHSVPTCQSIIKKAVVDNMKESYHKDWFKEDGPKYKIKFTIYKDKVLLMLDTSGEGLHKRGYRDLSTTAPLQETIAAGMINLSRWNKDRILIDPFCGSGTIPIEAAMIAKNQAPGLYRNFAAERWPIFPVTAWNEVKRKARSEIEDIEPRLIIGNDIDDNVVGIARHHAEKAGVSDIIHFQQKDFYNFSSSRKYGYVISNPPYGERSGEKEEVEKLYKIMGEKFSELNTWSFYILTTHQKFENIYGKEASKRRKLYNGGLECQFYQYYGPWPSSDE
ncbi:MAG TPA: class I SAM-dependent RNA methyltransferase [Halanaerobiales bacterium]|nr:class I SAM-dependent RNA methyltransferase [Halanaerobiales bacterium]